MWQNTIPAEAFPVEKQAATKKQEDRRSNTLLKWGYLFLIVSSALYVIEEVIDVGRVQDNFAVFFVHYFIAIAYTVVLLFHKSLGIVRSFKPEHISKTIVLLNLFLISAYALNREIPVFEESVKWLCFYVVISSLAGLSFHYFSKLPKALNKLQYVCLGSALVLYLYLAIYCGNYYIFGGIGILALGIGAHILVPIFLVIASVALIRDSRRGKKISYGWVALGFGITVAWTSGFVAQWNLTIDKIERIANHSVLHPDTALPVWVKVAQTLNNTWVTERILKDHLVYTTAHKNFGWDFFPSRRWDEQRRHDPLVFISSLTRRAPLSEEDRVKILLALTGNRHKAEERLWSGDNLLTSYIVTDADIYPDLRLAYTERYFNIRNTLPANQRWGTTQEAIYTFQLPEGSVVTSLSLWVNGKEEKAILTSKQKANNAYKTIVGVERRDPSIVHWQEGNTVSVRVFPCIPTEERKFKIGITSPLPVENGKLVYKAINFRGPSAQGATEAFRIRFVSNPSELNLPYTFGKNEKGEYVSEGDHDDDFELSFKAGPVRANQFSFDGYTYSLSPFEPVLKSRQFSDLYLDINRDWSQDDLASMRSLVGVRKLYTFVDDQLISLDEENWDQVTSSLLMNNFSVFPFHRIDDVDLSLVISKGRELSPVLRDFKDSKFATQVGDFFASGKKVSVFNISSSMSTYIRSLRELRALEFASGSMEQLMMFLHEGQFPVTVENEEQVVVHDARLVIKKNAVSEETIADNAPDHLARLFAYNNIMRQVGSHYFSEDFINQKLVDEAVNAYVVSPVSSLIVLETAEDYKRFDIHDDANSLHNASKQSSGAVPEPHEWALIILFALLVVFCFHRQRYMKTVVLK